MLVGTSDGTTTSDASAFVARPHARRIVRYRSCRPPEVELRLRLGDLANERRRIGYVKQSIYLSAPPAGSTLRGNEHHEQGTTEAAGVNGSFYLVSKQRRLSRCLLRDLSKRGAQGFGVRRIKVRVCAGGALLDANASSTARKRGLGQSEPSPCRTSSPSQYLIHRGEEPVAILSHATQRITVLGRVR
ncbi:hypothetical protein F4695_003904 [Rhizobium soli]|uniref:Uncharacterized protein n=1 Tax=Rhizobium soli TaxID=424798 RepID=A0A7X0MVN0_9HYPH|nr:hypothetical protein [Rhizobium soli]